MESQIYIPLSSITNSRWKSYNFFWGILGKRQPGVSRSRCVLRLSPQHREVSYGAGRVVGRCSDEHLRFLRQFVVTMNENEDYRPRAGYAQNKLSKIVSLPSIPPDNNMTQSPRCVHLALVGMH